MRVSLNNLKRWWTHREAANGAAASDRGIGPDLEKADPYRVNGNGNGHAKANGNSRVVKAKKSQKPATTPADPPWLLQIDRAGIPRSLHYPSTTLGRLLDQTADRFGDADAIAYHNLRWSYRELLAQTNRVAAGLACLGVRRGDRVLMTLPNCPEFVTTFFAVQKLGAVVVNCGPLMGRDDLAEAIHLTRPRVCVGLDLRAALLTHADENDCVEHFVWTSLQSYQTALRRLGYQWKLWQARDAGNGKHATGKHPNGHSHDHSASGRPRHMTMAEMIEHAPSRPPTVAPSVDHTAVLQPTGGTTGSLKLAQLTHRSLLANCTQVSVWMGLKVGQESILAVLPLFHVYGLTMNLLAGVFGAAKIVLETRFDGPETLGLLRKHKINIFPLVPAICDALSKLLEAEEHPEPLKDLRLCISGAAPLLPASAERFQRLTGACVIEGYGLTEASPVTHAGLPGNPRPGFIGLPLPDTRVRVVDPETGTDVAPGETGEMLIAGPQLMAGYLAMPAQTQAALQRDSAGVTWLHTGDIVRYDEEGYFQVVDRKKDMINHSGLKVFPTRVERVLQNHPQVKEAAVVGRADAQYTEMVVAVVAPVSEPEDPRKLEQELRALCREHLSPYEVPAKVEFMKALPRTPLGKLMRKELRGEIADCRLPIDDSKSNCGDVARSSTGDGTPPQSAEPATQPTDAIEQSIGNRQSAIGNPPKEHS